MTDPDQAVFHRPELAARLVADLLEPPAASPVRSGLFLAAPRRTGKSTFLIADLVPALRAAGAHVLYIDLWEDPAKDPAQAIVEAVGASVADEKRAAAKLVRAIGRIETVSAAGMVTVSLRRPDGGVVDVSLTRALKALSETIERTIVLIVDEAQQAITTDAGSRAMFALKAARDALNIARPHGLRIVATGSNRDKLAMLRSAKDQAFYGAPLTRFPPLGEGYVRWALERHGLIDVLELATAVELFDRCGHEPGGGGDPERRPGRDRLRDRGRKTWPHASRRPSTRCCARRISCGCAKCSRCRRCRARCCTRWRAPGTRTRRFMSERESATRVECPTRPTCRASPACSPR